MGAAVGLLGILASASDEGTMAHMCRRALNEWCDANCVHHSTHGSLVALLGTNSRGDPLRWRCYARHTLTDDLNRYAGGVDYCTRHEQLRRMWESCLRQGPGPDVKSFPGLAEDHCAEGPHSAAEGPPGASPSYLVFSVADNEQVNKQRRAFMYYMRKAREMGRTLVMPRIHMLRKNPQAWSERKGLWYFPDATEYVPASYVYNLTRIKEYVPAIEVDELWATSDPHIDVLFASSSRSRSCENGEDVAVGFNGIQGVHVASFRCSPLTEDEAIRAERVVGALQVYDQVPEANAKDLLPHLLFVDSVYAEAHDFVSRVFDGEPFLAVHWRRSDFKITRAARDDVLVDVPTMIRRIRSKLTDHGLRRVYLATDATEEEDLQTILDELDVVRVPQTAPSPDGTEDLAQALHMASVGTSFCSMRPKCMTASPEEPTHATCPCPTQKLQSARWRRSSCQRARLRSRSPFARNGGAPAWNRLGTPSFESLPGSMPTPCWTCPGRSALGSSSMLAGRILSSPSIGSGQLVRLSRALPADSRRTGRRPVGKWGAGGLGLPQVQVLPG